MENFICKTCGVEYAESETPPVRCPICEDPRQYVGWEGQQWTTMAQLKADGYKNDVRQKEPSLIGVGITPSFTIGIRYEGLGTARQFQSCIDEDRMQRLINSSNSFLVVWIIMA